MKLVELRLNNIRSYTQETVAFPSGTTLLSGDIGSGKSTILLGIEFALFGLIRGSFSGTSLLRHSENEGSVTLTFTVGDDTVTVHRELSRTKRTVRQDTGWYEVNGERTEATAREIKAFVIDTLGYPASLVTKSKAMVYRYSVYTPQEAMKEILREKPDERLEKVRRIFRIDKYNRVKENSEKYARELRRDIKQLKKSVDGLQKLKEKREEKQEDIKEAKKESEEFKDELKAVQKKKKDVESALEETQADKEAYDELVKKRETTKASLKNYEDETRTLEKQVAKYKKRLGEELDEPETELQPVSKYEGLLEKVEDRLEKLREKRSTAKSKHGLYKEKIGEHKKFVESIDALETCPTCGQDVTEKHRKTVHEERKKKIDALKKKLGKVKAFHEKVKEKTSEFQDKKKRIQEKLRAARKHEKQVMLYKQKKKERSRLESDLKEAKNRLKELEDRKTKASKKLDEFTEQIQSKQDAVEALNSLKKRRESLNKRVNNVEVQKAKREERVKNLEETVRGLTDRIEDKEKEQRLIEEKQRVNNWVKTHFTNLMDLMERHVLHAIHQRFDQSFRSFFNTLLEDDAISVDADDQFSPRVTQSGYDVEISDLSGGEKTSVALAYRLALNDVINDYMDDVKTRDILILDEPTDGFSSEQLDRLRDVLDSLHCDQVLIVSHEEKLEGVTENILRVRKTSGHSTVTQV